MPYGPLAQLLCSFMQHLLASEEPPCGTWPWSVVRAVSIWDATVGYRIHLVVESLVDVLSIHPYVVKDHVLDLAR